MHGTFSQIAFLNARRAFEALPEPAGRCQRFVKPQVLQEHVRRVGEGVLYGDPRCLRLAERRWVWDFHGNCVSPIFVEETAPRGEQGCAGPREVLADGQLGKRLSPRASGLRKRQLLREPVHFPHVLTMVIRCRKCKNCRKARAAAWTVRGMAETEAAEATHFVTWTATKRRQYFYRQDARRAAMRAGHRWDDEIGAFATPALYPGEKFKWIAREMADEASNTLKRLRHRVYKRVGEYGTIRAQIVVERHKSGKPHLHLLIHESTHGVIKRRDLGTHVNDAPNVQAQCIWHHGWASTKSVDKDDPRQVGYIAKYVGDGAARNRASKGYGSPPGVEQASAQRVDMAALCAAMQQREADAEAAKLVGRIKVPATEPCEDVAEVSLSLAAFPGARVIAVRPLEHAPESQGSAAGLTFEDQRVAYYRSRAPGGVRSPPALLLG